MAISAKGFHVLLGFQVLYIFFAALVKT